MECINKVTKKKRTYPVHWGCGDNQIATSAKLLDVKYKFYGFSGDLIEIII